MIEAKQVAAAQGDALQREKLLKEQQKFILRSASRAAGRFVDIHDDLYSEALMAFNDAIDGYAPGKGSFSAFASRVIGNRVIDTLRREKDHAQTLPFSSLSARDDHGDEKAFDIADPHTKTNEAAVEIQALKQELAAFGIDFFDLPAVSPKAGKTKTACREAMRCIASRQDLLNYLRKKKQLPAAHLKQLGVGEKVLERHRKYIIAGVLILSGDYEFIGQYLKF